jgi:hypothetical protein
MKLRNCIKKILIGKEGFVVVGKERVISCQFAFSGVSRPWK